VRTIFCGTPEIAVPSLLALSEISEIVGVVCQPDRPAGRGMRLTPPAVKVAAERASWEVFQPTKMRDGSLARWMSDKRADLALVIAYGRILTADTLCAPRLGCLNLHASLLPRYRGAAPIQRALMNGERETGVCLMQMDEGMDTGPVLACHGLTITPDDDAGTLTEKLGQLAATVTRTELPRFFRGELQPVPQPWTSRVSGAARSCAPETCLRRWPVRPYLAVWWAARKGSWSLGRRRGVCW
jgi:methionyl-tRNA formyltransferase